MNSSRNFETNFNGLVDRLTRVHGQSPRDVLLAHSLAQSNLDGLITSGFLVWGMVSRASVTD
jgi:hypothetical protein